MSWRLARMQEALARMPRAFRDMRWLLLPITLAGFALRAYLLGAQNVWWDEGLAIWAVRKGLIPMTLWTAGDVHPPLYFWGLYAITRVAGETEFAARFPSLIYGVLLIPLAYQLGRKMISVRVGLLAAALLAVARFPVWWSQEMRMYIGAAFWGAASLYALARWWTREQRGDSGAWKALLPYVLASAAALYSLYLCVFVLLVENAFVLLMGLRLPQARRWPLWRRWVLSQMATLLLFLPWLGVALPRMQSWSTATPFHFASFLRLYATVLALGISTYIERYTWVVAPFLLIVASGLWLAWRGRKAQGESWPSGQVALLLLLCLTVPPAAVYLLTMPRHLFYAPTVEARYLLPFALPFYLLLAWSISLLWHRSRWLGAIALLFVGGAFAWTLPQHYAGRYQRDELQSMVRMISAYAQEGDAVVVVSGSRYPIWDYYYRDPLRPGRRPPVYFVPQGTDVLTPENVTAQLAPLAEAHPRIWLALVAEGLQDPQGMTKVWFDSQRRAALQHTFGYHALLLYTATGETPTIAADALYPQETLRRAIAGWGTLLGYDLPTREFRPGDTIHLALYRQGPGESAALCELRDAAGRVLEQRRLTPSCEADEIERHAVDIAIYDRTPPGRYSFFLASENDVAGEWLRLASIEVSGTPPLRAVRAVGQPLGIMVGDQIQLEGYDWHVVGRRAGAAEVRPGDRLQLTLYWRALDRVDARYTVFTHFLGEAYNPVTAGPVWAQHDSEPLEGGWPTTQWFVDYLIADSHTLDIPAETPPGAYQIEVGMYDILTHARLPVTDTQGQPSGDRVLLSGWRVVAP